MTDYFKMMQDVVGSYGEGLDLARSRARFDAEEARKAQEFEWRKRDQERKTADMLAEDTAIGDMRTLNTVGRVDYGGETGARGLQAAEGDYKREAARMGLPRADVPTGARAVAAAPATDRDFNRAEMGLALARRDAAGISAARTAGKKLDIADTTNENIKRAAEDPEFLRTMVGHLNLNNGRTTIDQGLDEKGKRVRPASITYVRDDGGVHVIQPSATQLKTVASALAHMQHGEVETGIQLLAGVDKTIAEAAAKEAGIQHLNFDSNTKAAGEFDKAEYQRGVLANSTARLGLDRANANRPSYGQPIQMVGKDGQPALMQPIRGKDGSVKYEQVQLPEGFRFPKQVDPARVEARANALVGTDMPGLVNGKKVKYDANTAYEAAQRQLYGDTGGAGVEMPAVKPPPRVPVTPAPTVSALPLGDRQLADRAKASGYEGSIGRDGKLWFSRVTNGQGENLTPRQVADRLGLVYD